MLLQWQAMVGITISFVYFPRLSCKIRSLEYNDLYIVSPWRYYCNFWCIIPNFQPVLTVRVPLMYIYLYKVQLFLFKMYKIMGNGFSPPSTAFTSSHKQKRLYLCTAYKIIPHFSKKNRKNICSETQIEANQII